VSNPSEHVEAECVAVARDVKEASELLDQLIVFEVSRPSGLGVGPHRLCGLAFEGLEHFEQCVDSLSSRVRIQIFQLPDHRRKRPSLGTVAELPLAAVH
jgi:hypothetical protein